MSDELVASTLRRLHRSRDPRFRQYVAYLHKPDGWTLDAIAQAVGVSRQRIRVIEIDAYKEIDAGNVQDLSHLPVYMKRRKAHNPYLRPLAIPPVTAALLKDLNAQARDKTLRPKQRKPTQETFLNLVANLVESGVSMAEIARAIGENPRAFRRRMERHKLTTTRPQRKSMQRVHAEQRLAEEQLAAEAASIAAGQVPCRWPDCPSHTGGACIHQ